MSDQPQKRRTTRAQRQMYEDARRRIASADRIFMEIMAGPNPLTPEELRRLIDKRPELWGRYERFAAPRSE